MGCLGQKGPPGTPQVTDRIEAPSRCMASCMSCRPEVERKAQDSANCRIVLGLALGVRPLHPKNPGFPSWWMRLVRPREYALTSAWAAPLASLAGNPQGGGPFEARTVALAAASISRANRTSEGRSPALQPRLSASAARSIPLSRAASAGWLTNTETSMKPGSSRRLLSCPCARIARSSARERTTARAGNPTSFTALGQRRPWTIRNRPERSDHDRHLLADASGQIGGIHIRDGKPVRRP